ncbi:protein borderless-like [Leguminivora glycinivorella]|uniref:protein borderless-like n=1 Tax=Leguminivora glycinivorella TaxID=1035111 RepID=UPI00200CDA76|nr:protein borderless-like [Leguminivora glycinivorella]XP_047991065.1 protein borderless-like [Leguminivora glycinivorella]XP_047991073.1 protein borderless-like [Leguminivora glycinivorella]
MVLWLLLSAAAAAAAAAGALLPHTPERLRASVGGFAVMNCHLDFPFGNEIPYHLQWDKDGEMVLSWLSGWEAPAVGERWGGRARRVSAAAAAGGALGGGSLNVSSVRESDAGLFRCRVSFPNRSPPARNNGTFYYLDVDGGTVIAAPPVNVTVVEGERAELECGAKEPAAAVAWSRGGGPLPALAELPPNGSLVLPAALAADAGLYQCSVRHEDRHQTAEAYLDVQYKAKVIYAPEERYLPLGKPASLDCHFSANPPLTNLRWEKDGFLFDPYNVPGVFYSRNGSLLFNRVDESHEGQYSCTAYNALGSSGPSPRVRVRVQRPPALLARPQPLYLARLGQPLALPCAAAHQPHHDPPLIIWTRKDGSPLPAERFTLEEGKLSISAVAEEDRGVLVCTVSNEAADVSAETELLIENLPPRAPYNLTARPAAHAIHLAWVPGRRGVDAEYTVWYRERAAHEWRTLRLLSRGVTEASLTGLRSATPHELRVLATDSLGDGLFSKPLFVTTLDPDVDESEAAFVAAVTETGDGAATAGDDELEDDGADAAHEPIADAGAARLEVTVRLLDAAALVRWAGAGAGRCDVRWYRDEPAGRRLLATAHTHHDHLLVSSVEEGARYWAGVRCGAAAGGAGVAVPAYARLRLVAGVCAGAALLLAAAAAALVLLRRRLPCARARRSSPTPAPQLPPPPPKRRY